MSRTTPFSLPGFEFLQQMGKTTTAAIPGLANLTALQQWATPSLDPAELDKRIDELRTVQFWLEQNAKLIATTIQTLEVQRMTLSALQAMNVSMHNLGDAMRLKPQPAAAPAPAPKAEPKPQPKAEPATPEAAKPKAAPSPAPSAAAQAAAGMIDPMQWWQALTTQFSQLAQQAVKSPPPTKKEGGAAANIKSAGKPAAKAAKPSKAATKKAAPRKK